MPVATGINPIKPNAMQLAMYRAFAERFFNMKRAAQSNSPIIEPCHTKWIRARLMACARGVIWSLLQFDPAVFQSPPAPFARAFYWRGPALPALLRNRQTHARPDRAP